MSDKNILNTINHIKPSAKSAKFLNCNSYYLLQLFIQVNFLSEANRLENHQEKNNKEL